MIKQTKFFKTTTLAFLIALGPTFGIASSASAAGLQSQMDKLFGDMSNVTAPGAYMTQRRGVLTGGRITQKSKMFNENLVSFAPPSWKAGCGGVDMFGGALSFINKDQIVALLRAVAANSKGYFFQLALDNTCPSCSKWIETFQKKIQELNQFMGNSCQLAQGLMNDASNLLPFDIKHKTDASLIGSSKGFFNDFFDAKEQSSGKSAVQELKKRDPAKAKEMSGNVTWKQLRENNAKNWYMLGDDDLMHAILSLAGSVIIGEPQNDSYGEGDDSVPVHFLPGYQITLADLMYGGNLKLYDCSGDKEQCAGTNGVVNKKTVQLTGFAAKIDSILQGSGTNNGLIYKYVNHRNFGDLSQEEKAFLEILPGGVGSTIRQLSTLSPDAADLFAREASAALALNMVYHLVDNLFRSANIAIANSKSQYKSQAIEELAKSRRAIQEEFAVLQGVHGDIISLLERNNALISNVRKQKYTLQSISKPATYSR